MIYIFKMPVVGEGILEGEIVKWEVAEGDSIEVDATLVEIQNDKLVQEVPSPVTGTIVKLLVEEGAVVEVGDPLAEIDAPDYEGSVDDTADKETKETKATEEVQEVVKQEEKVEAPVMDASPTELEAGSSVVAGRVLAMPSVRQYARDKGIEVTQVSGTGKHGHITLEDVDSYVAGPSETAVVDTQAVAKSAPAKTAILEAQSIPSTEATTREKMSPTRRAISEAMVNSKAHAPHVTIFDEVEVSKLMDHRKRFKEVAAKQDISLTFLAYMTKAVVAVVRKFPILNASVDEVTEEIVYKNFFNIGIAVDTERGLFVPNIKDADRKGIFSVAKEISSLAQKSHDGSLASAEMTNGTTTITNIGSAWGMWFTPIINYPEVAIFGMGRIGKKPVVLEDGTVGVGSVLHLSMSFDHRIVDGAVAQNAMNELKRLMADPELLLMEG